jgi:predicted DNA binding CopG/RHH family protein
MKTRSGASKRKTTSARDAQLREFERRDLGDDIRASGAARLIQLKQRPTSILLDPDLVRILRAKAAKRGLRYQTMLKLIVREQLHRY